MGFGEGSQEESCDLDGLAKSLRLLVTFGIFTRTYIYIYVCAINRLSTFIDTCLQTWWYLCSNPKFPPGEIAATPGESEEDGALAGEAKEVSEEDRLLHRAYAHAVGRWKAGRFWEVLLHMSLKDFC